MNTLSLTSVPLVDVVGEARGRTFRMRAITGEENLSNGIENRQVLGGDEMLFSALIALPHYDFPLKGRYDKYSYRF